MLYNWSVMMRDFEFFYTNKQNKNFKGMKPFLCLLLITNLAFPGYSQTLKNEKPPVDSAAIAESVRLMNGCVISDDGNYFYYLLDNYPLGEQTLIVSST